MAYQEWDPTQYFHPTSPPNPFALLILNQPINERAFADLHRHAKFTVCADGGANRYFDRMRRHGRESTDLPNAIVGDLDSIRASVRSHYTGLGVEVVEDADQYSTDFTKCLRFLRGWFASRCDSNSSVGSEGTRTARRARDDNSDDQLDILILGGLGGRVDQAFSQIHHLYSVSLSAGESERDAPPGNLYLVSEESITFVLRQGRNVILTPGNRPSPSQSQLQSQPGDRPGERPATCLEENIGLIPLTGPTRITTRGFQWDVQDWRTVIGGDLSTSNHIRAQQVEVECEQAILFTVELAARLKVGRSGCSSSTAE